MDHAMGEGDADETGVGVSPGPGPIHDNRFASLVVWRVLFFPGDEPRPLEVFA
jgi:hypothetical protein